ncbi:hypothetical protein F5X99DRAFT_406625 [Biscogniauxia marginata]|nr:hypothetical protein F5X99DRAFT_406625 [Biscogniauxia marginata]
MDETEAWKTGILAQSPKEESLDSKPEAEQSEPFKHQPADTEERWGKYADSVNMLGFGNLDVPDTHQSSDQHNPDKPGQFGEDLQSAGSFGNSKAIASTQLSAVLNNKFGQASPPRYGFSEPVWKPQTATAVPPMERSLEDLYKDHPEKQLGGIDQSDLNLAAGIILQITNEATMQWLNRWCPNMPWSKLIDATNPDAALDVFSSHYHVPMEATSLGNSKTTVAHLFRQCHKLRHECSVIQLKDLFRISDQCILLCEALKDQKRKVLLEKSNEIIQWVSIGLDCKKMSVHRQASDELSKLNQTYRELQESGPVDEKLSKSKEEVEILDQAMLSYKEHRTTFSMSLLNGLQVLLESTSMFRPCPPH